jgi:predicted MFS family arabinose efflux permease
MLMRDFWLMCGVIFLFSLISESFRPANSVAIRVYSDKATYVMFLLPLFQGLIAATLYVIIISFGEILVMPFSSTWSVRRANDARQGQYLALYSMAYSVSNAVAPLVGTQTIATYGFNALWLLLVVLSTGTLLEFWFLERSDK